MKAFLGCLLTIVAVCTSCGYHFSNVDRPARRALPVPYIKGDLDGRLTSHVIEALTTSSRWRYTQGEAEYILEAEILKNFNDYIGYQYDHLESGALIDRLVPNEGRKTILVKIGILKSATQEVVYGPYEIGGSSDYDFVNSDTYTDMSFIDSKGVPHSVLAFSLGQLDAEQDARRVTLQGAYKEIAQKIAVGLDNL